jgi:hypothetical protein
MGEFRSLWRIIRTGSRQVGDRGNPIEASALTSGALPVARLVEDWIIQLSDAAQLFSF